MPKFTVRFEPVASLDVTVEAEDYDEAIEEAYGERPDICGNCAGAWPGQKHSLELNLEGAEACEVIDESGKTIWSTPSYLDSLHSDIKSLREQLEEARKAKD